VSRKRQARKCAGKRTDGEPCGSYAINGGTVCSAHGAQAPQVKAKAAEAVIEARLERLMYRHQAEPFGDPIEALQRLIGRAMSWEAAIGDRVNELTAIRFTDEHGAEQIRAEVAVLERAMDRCGKLLVDIAKLNLEERLARVTELQAQMAMDALSAAMREIGLTPEQQKDARTRIARHLRAV
jgi:hypothetical protein